MCTIFVGYHYYAGHDLFVVGNRDEFRARPTLPAHLWSEPSILAGRDERSGGTWLAADKTGRFAALTNIRGATNEGPQSRGALIPNFLAGTQSAMAFVIETWKNRARYGAFNLIVFDGEHLAYCATWCTPIQLPPGLYGLSNATLDVPWPKVARTKALLASDTLDLEDHNALITLMMDNTKATTLPYTGIPEAQERALSALFVDLPDYGTRTSAILDITATRVDFREYTHMEDRTLPEPMHLGFKREEAPQKRTSAH